jgi:hypothetical protein
MSQAFDCGAPNVGSSVPYQGQDINWEGTTYIVQSGTLIQNYSGNDINFGGTSLSNLTGDALSQLYSGYTTTFGAGVNLTQQATVHDPKPINTYPKNRTIYYKLAGFNTNTQQLEVWVVSEVVTTRPETFIQAGSTTQNPPSVDLSLFLTPPSGHALVNIKIVARWLQ